MLGVQERDGMELGNANIRHDAKKDEHEQRERAHRPMSSRPHAVHYQGSRIPSCTK